MIHHLLIMPVTGQVRNGMITRAYIWPGDRKVIASDCEGTLIVFTRLVFGPRTCPDSDVGNRRKQESKRCT